MVYKKLRIKYSRKGMLRFISHLDICRTIRTAFRRAGIDIKYSEGYNPHPKMTFLLPLPLGAQSECEYMDIYVPENASPEQTAQRLDAVTAPELHFIKAYTPVNALSDAAQSDYVITLFGARLDEIKAILDDLPAIRKKNKKGVVNEIDIRQMVRSAEALECNCGVTVKCRLDCTEQSYLNPETFACLFPCDDHRVMRTALYLSDGREFE